MTSRITLTILAVCLLVAPVISDCIEGELGYVNVGLQNGIIFKLIRVKGFYQPISAPQSSVTRPKGRVCPSPQRKRSQIGLWHQVNSNLLPVTQPSRWRHRLHQPLFQLQQVMMVWYWCSNQSTSMCSWHSHLVPTRLWESPKSATVPSRTHSIWRIKQYLSLILNKQ